MHLLVVALFCSLFATIKCDKTEECSEVSSMTMRATLGAGCYWGTEKFITNEWGSSGRVTRSAVGFMGGEEPNPSYAFVKTGKTAHIEVLDVDLSDTQGVGAAALYEDLIRYFFQFHDSTTLGRQGHDVGPQYASVIFVYDDIQREIATRVKEELNQLIASGKITHFEGDQVTTLIEDASTFYAAEDYHQNYLVKNPEGECNHELRFTEWPTIDTQIA